MNGGIIGDDCFLSKGSLVFNVPLVFVSFAGTILSRGYVSIVGEGFLEDSDGVSMCIEFDCGTGTRPGVWFCLKRTVWSRCLS